MKEIVILHQKIGRKYFSFGEIHPSTTLGHLIVNIYRNISKTVKDAWQCQMSIGEMEK